MKLFLLTAGSSYYPRPGQADWQRTFSTREEALAAVKTVDYTRKITRGKRAGEEEVTLQRYLIDGVEHDWCEVIDLSKWVFETETCDPPAWGPFTT